MKEADSIMKNRSEAILMSAGMQLRKAKLALIPLLNHIEASQDIDLRINVREHAYKFEFYLNRAVFRRFDAMFPFDEFVSFEYTFEKLLHDTSPKVPFDSADAGTMHSIFNSLAQALHDLSDGVCILAYDSEWHSSLRPPLYHGVPHCFSILHDARGELRKLESILFDVYSNAEIPRLPNDEHIWLFAFAIWGSWRTGGTAGDGIRGSGTV